MRVFCARSTAPVSAAAVSTSAATAPASPVTGVLELSSAGTEVGASDEGETGASEETAAVGLLSSVLSASDVVAAGSVLVTTPS
ncbi:MAG: hypothetical protein ACLUFV_14015 [Acutalibacteraceae bacterium]